jgi:hypothetical protein
LATASEEQSRFFKRESMKMRLERARKNRQDILVDRVEKAVMCAEPKVIGSFSAKTIPSNTTVIVHCANGHYEQMFF